MKSPPPREYHHSLQLTLLSCSALVPLRTVFVLCAGSSSEHQKVVLPLSFPGAGDSRNQQQEQKQEVEGRWRTQRNGARVLPIRTHLLCHLDDPVSVVRRYAAALAQPGDVVAIAESALAVMQVSARPAPSVLVAPSP